MNSRPLTLYQFVQRYTDLHQHAAPSPPHARKGILNHKMNHLNIDDTDSDSDENTDGVIDPNRPWLDEWNTYFNTHEVVLEGMGIVRW